MFDAYTLRARLMPPALAAAPAILLVVPSLGEADPLLTVMLLLVSAVACVACGAVRDRGRGIEAALWESWGGPPTVQLLRWAGPSTIENVSRRHRLITDAIGLQLPDAETERSDPAAADSAYEDAVLELREVTRSNSEFPLVLAENIDYGFRRNALGLRPFGMAIAAVAFGAAGCLALASRPAFVIPMVIALIAFAFWQRAVTAEWVRSAADQYAERLIEACSLLKRQQRVAQV